MKSTVCRPEPCDYLAAELVAFEDELLEDDELVLLELVDPEDFDDDELLEESADVLLLELESELLESLAGTLLEPLRLSVR